MSFSAEWLKGFFSFMEDFSLNETFLVQAKKNCNFVFKILRYMIKISKYFKMELGV